IAVQVAHPAARFVQALALGDTRGLSDADWEHLRALGLTHLVAISGFHVGVVAGFGVLLCRLWWWLCRLVGGYWPRPQAAA
ncbi:ComEC/Rec2 family competence protein, partial [Enterobacter hormaechei]|uniref:ComEC/Rec2 family competence protein n=1 Tax=Enterobacter hormaechei TaxID=158836 RepID=UPI00203BD064